MEKQKRGLFLFLSASLVAIAGCAAPGGESGDFGREEADDVAEGAQAVCAAGALDCANWGAWEAIPGITGACGVPATAYYGDYLLAAYPACGTNQIYVTSYHAGTWATPYAVTGALSAYSPSLTVAGDNLYLGYAGLDNKVSVHRYNGFRWGDIGDIGIHSTFAPALAAFNDRLHVIYGGPESELFVTAWDGRFWSPGIGWGVHSAATPGVAVYGDRLYAAYPSVRGRIGVGYWDGAAFGGRAYLPGVASRYAPTLAAFDGYLNFFYPSHREGGFGWAAYDGANWAGHVVIPSRFGDYSPVLGHYGQHAALFARGQGDQIYWARHKAWAP